MPRVSFLIPVFNGAATLAASLRSALEQHYDDLEVVVVDDGSTDESAVIVERLAVEDGRLRLVRISHGGIVDALNAGLEACEGEFIARLDADDRALPKRIERQVRALDEHPEWVAVGCGVRLWEGGGDELLDGEEHSGMRHYLQWVNGLQTPETIAAARFIESPVIHTSALIRGETLRGVGGYRHAPSPEDYDLWLRLLGQGLRIGKVPDILQEIGDSPHRLTRTDATCSREAFWDCRLTHLVEGPLARHQHALVYGAGTTGKRLLRDLAVRGRAALVAGDGNPRRHGAIIHGARILSLEALADHRDSLPTTPPVVIAIAAHGARQQLLAWAGERGWREGQDFFFIAGMT